MVDESQNNSKAILDARIHQKFLSDIVNSQKSFNGAVKQISKSVMVNNSISTSVMEEALKEIDSNAEEANIKLTDQMRKDAADKLIEENKSRIHIASLFKQSDQLALMGETKLAKEIKGLASELDHQENIRLAKIKKEEDKVEKRRSREVELAETSTRDLLSNNFGMLGSTIGSAFDIVDSTIQAFEVAGTIFSRINEFFGLNNIQLMRNAEKAAEGAKLGREQQELLSGKEIETDIKIGDDVVEDIQGGDENVVDELDDVKFRILLGNATLASIDGTLLEMFDRIRNIVDTPLLEAEEYAMPSFGPGAMLPAPQDPNIIDGEFEEVTENNSILQSIDKGIFGLLGMFTKGFLESRKARLEEKRKLRENKKKKIDVEGEEADPISGLLGFLTRIVSGIMNVFKTIGRFLLTAGPVIVGLMALFGFVSEFFHIFKESREGGDSMSKSIFKAVIGGLAAIVGWFTEMIGKLIIAGLEFFNMDEEAKALEKWMEDNGLTIDGFSDAFVELADSIWDMVAGWIDYLNNTTASDMFKDLGKAAIKDTFLEDWFPSDPEDKADDIGNAERRKVTMGVGGGAGMPTAVVNAPSSNVTNNRMVTGTGGIGFNESMRNLEDN